MWLLSSTVSDKAATYNKHLRTVQIELFKKKTKISLHKWRLITPDIFELSKVYLMYAFLASSFCASGSLYYIIGDGFVMSVDLLSRCKISFVYKFPRILYDYYGLSSTQEYAGSESELPFYSRNEETHLFWHNDRFQKFSYFVLRLMNAGFAIMLILTQ